MYICVYIYIYICVRPGAGSRWAPASWRPPPPGAARPAELGNFHEHDVMYMYSFLLFILTSILHCTVTCYSIRIILHSLPPGAARPAELGHLREHLFSLLNLQVHHLFNIFYVWVFRWD